MAPNGVHGWKGHALCKYEPIVEVGNRMKSRSHYEKGGRRMTNLKQSLQYPNGDNVPCSHMGGCRGQ